jgi:predicted O-linked N-acetylglucosamine transferase (SPINDLY family)
MSASVQRKLQQAHQHLANGNAAAAAPLCLEVLQRAPRNPDALWLLGAARLMAGDANEAAALLERAIAAAPRHGAALEQLGVAHYARGDYAAAEKALRTAAALPGAPLSVLSRLGHACAAQGNWPEARRVFDALLARAPDDLDTLYNLGLADMELGDAARACAQFERVIARAPDHHEARERLAAAYLALGRYAQAASELERVVHAQPTNVDAICALAEATFQKGEVDAALGLAGRARDLDLQRAATYGLIAQIHHVRGELDLAVEALEAGYALTDDDLLLATLVHITHRQCDWPKWSPLWEKMKARLDSSVRLGSPLWLLSEDTTAAQQLSYTRRWAATSYPPAPAPPPRRKRAPHERIRIGYYSGDFHQHPVPCLAVEVFELHDHDRFEVFAYSYGPDDGSPLRARLANAFEHFVDVAWEPDDAVERRIRADGLDILVDIKGYTAGDRLSVMARRPCAIQVEWLGYPGTMGAAFIDYVVADPVIIPPDAQQHFSERVLRMPHCYQANDRKRARPEPRSRADYGLPAQGFVFCCFNQASKITPEVFARWMSLLRKLPDAVLWLLDDNAWATRNLLAAAEAAGVPRDRVVIAPRLPVTEHLARYRAADLALDTFPYTSHTTGSDALWEGCPLVALCGETFAARVSTSLLENCGMHDLVTHTLDDYEALASRLASEPQFMHDVRTRLAAARDTAPLFDPAAFARELEALYLQMLG